MWNKKKIKKFIKANKIDTGNSINKYKTPKIKKRDNLLEIRLPFWATNDVLQKSLLDLGSRAIEKGKVQVRFENNKLPNHDEMILQFSK